jgi:predicted ferric reductase
MDGMDMAMDPEVMNLPLSDPRCVQAAEGCMAFGAAANASQAAIPWASQFDYGHYVTWYWIVALGLATLWYLLLSLKDTGVTRSGTSRPGLSQKIQAAGRFVFYRHFTYPRGSLALPPFGYSAFIVATTVFLTGLVFAQRPYYREQLGYGAPPIAIRTGLMAYACTPILVALSQKANIVTLLTGISHERLNVLHRWVAWLSFVLSLIHTIPFFYASANDYGNGGAQRVKSEFYFWGTKIGGSEYSGVPALAVLFALCVLSLPQIRNWAYETFFGLHILLAITHLGLLFWHGGNLGDSWAYLWATLAVWAASWLVRAFWKTQSFNIRESWMQASAASVTPLVDDVTKIQVWPASKFTWKPGQHVFLRFVGIAPLDNHPFTIAAAPSIVAKSPEKNEASTAAPLVFFARSHAGFTKRLLAYANNAKITEVGVNDVWIDGPYGGFNRPVHRIFHTVLLMAGGTGITACLPWLLHLVERARLSKQHNRTRRVVLIWALRHADAFSWVREYLLPFARERIPGFELSLSFYITRDEQALKEGMVSKTHVLDYPEDKEIQIVPAVSTEAEVETVTSQPAFTMGEIGTVKSGRPSFAQVLADHIGEGKNMVFGCGPESFNNELANSVAGAQHRVFHGECEEIKLHLETFGW